MVEASHDVAHDIADILEKKKREAAAERKESWLEKLYLPELFKGIWNATLHIFQKPFTIKYVGPNTAEKDRHESLDGYRGEHYLKRDENGMEKCVACYMCSTACPSECIEIDADEAPAEDFGFQRFKRPAVFNIDMLKCIYCGYCVEACPKDAIGMTTTFNQPRYNRADFIYGKDKLLSNNDEYMKKNKLSPSGKDDEGNYPLSPDGCGPDVTHGMHNSRVAERLHEMSEAMFGRK